MTLSIFWVCRLLCLFVRALRIILVRRSEDVCLKIVLLCESFCEVPRLLLQGERQATSANMHHYFLAFTDCVSKILTLDLL